MEVLDLKKTNTLPNLINHEPDIEKSYLYAKDLYEAKYQLFFDKRERTGLNYLKDSEAFIEYSNDMDEMCKNIEEYNPKNPKKCRSHLMKRSLICLAIKNLIQ